jgi:hypothetical protein
MAQVLPLSPPPPLSPPTNPPTSQSPSFAFKNTQPTPTLRTSILNQSEAESDESVPWACAATASYRGLSRRAVPCGPP